MGAPPDKVWPRADVRYLTKYYHITPVGKIVEHLGRTKSSVIGMAHRLGLSVTREEISRRMSEGMLKGKERKPRHKRKRKPQQFVKPPQPPPAPVVTTSGLTLLTLRDGQCKFPIGRKKVRIIDVKHDLTAFCGQPSAEGAVYCAEHMKIAYDRVRTRTSNMAQYNPLRGVGY